MFDIKAIRQNPDKFDSGWKRHGLKPQTPDLLQLDEQLREIKTKAQELQQDRNDKSRQIGQIKKEGGDAESIMQEVASLKQQLADLEDKERTVAESLNQHLAGLPNIMDEDVPDGDDEEDNVELRKWGEIKTQSGPDHAEIGEKLKMMDFETAAKLSGSRFTLLSGSIARLERALAQFFLDTHTSEHGYTEMSGPLMVRDEALFGTGQLPKFAEDQFRTTRGDWLIPTAEVSLTNIVADRILNEGELPLRFTSFTPCFRQEAGAAGKDTRGMLRQHQFYKVELVSITTPDKSRDEHERMTECAETVLKKLELPFRTVVLCSGDTGFGARKTYDIEAWLPGQEAYREISSCSNTGDFQARRMNARFKAEEDKKNHFVHTLNGSGVAVGRALIAVIENYYDPADGGVFIPDVLKPYMNHMEKITGHDINRQAAE